PYFAYRLDPRCSIETSPVVGRHFVATDDISTGVVLLEEKPYSLMLEREFMLLKCSNCHADLGHKLYPCEHCTELVFCNRQCFRQAFDTFHRFECGMVHLIANINECSLHIFRMISRVGPLQAYAIGHSLGGYSIEQYLADQAQRVLPEFEKSAEERNRTYKMASILVDHFDEAKDHRKSTHV